MSTDLAVIDDVQIVVSDTSWEPQGPMTFEAWQDAGEHLQRMGRAWQFWLGDWLTYGEKHYGETYAQAIDLTGFEVQTLMNIASVAKRVPQTYRRRELSWSHHAEVAALPPAEQDRWLDEAVREGMTRARLRARLSGVPKDAPDPDQQIAPTHIGRITFKLVAESDEHAHERVKELAALLERKGCRVTNKTAGAL